MPFETVAETLLRGGIAPRHVRRYVDELSDHLEDLNERQRAGDSKPKRQRSTHRLLYPLTGTGGAGNMRRGSYGWNPLPSPQST